MNKKGKTVSKAMADEDVMGMYIREICRIPLLSREEENKIARAAAQGNADARERLINGNLRFVINVAKKYQGCGLPLADLISEGNIGLMQAVDKFDADRGFRFISYAVWWIRQSMLIALYHKSRLIRLPLQCAGHLVRIEKAKKMLAGNSNSEPEIHEIAEFLSMDKDDVGDIMAISREVVSLEKEVTSESGALPLGCFIEDDRYDTPEQVAEKNALAYDIDKLLETLDSTEAEVLRFRFGLGQHHYPMFLQEIGERYNLSKERIRQIEKNALGHLRSPSRKARLMAYIA